MKTKAIVLLTAVFPAVPCRLLKLRNRVHLLHKCIKEIRLIMLTVLCLAPSPATACEEANEACGKTPGTGVFCFLPPLLRGWARQRESPELLLSPTVI